MSENCLRALAHVLTRGQSRRGLSRLVASLTLGVPAALAGREGAETRKKRKKKRKPKRWKPLTAFGAQGTGPDNFSRPRGVFLAADGKTAWVADGNNERVSVWRRSSATSTDWANWTTFGSEGSGTNQFFGPDGLFVSAEGLTVWVADGPRVSVWTRPTATSAAWANQTTFGTSGSGPSQFNGAQDVAVSPDGLTAWVLDNGNHRVSVWTRGSATATDWTNRTTFGGEGNGAYQFQWPTGLFVSADGLTTWVADNNNHRVSVWRRTSGASTDWAFQTSFGTEGSGVGQLVYPSDVAVAKDGLTAWVTEEGNDRVSIWKRPRAGSTAWTNTGTFGSEGSGADQFQHPWGIAVGGKTLLVGDFDNHRISVWALA